MVAERRRILTVVGNRPQFVKAAAVSVLLRKVADETLVHTGQHHDQELSAVFFRELGIPEPEIQLEVSGGTDSSQVERMKSLLESVITENQPDVVLVYGDTNSTLAGAEAAAAAGVPVAHVEAGMRSFDSEMPEERNRVATDRLSNLLICSTPVAVENLRREGLAGRIELVGDVMADVVAMVAERVSDRTQLLDELGLSRGEYLLVTAHRAGNVDSSEMLTRLLEVLEALPLPAVLPLHPRTAARLDEFGLRQRLDSITGLTVVKSLGYLDFQALLVNCRAVLTDSGGAQKEAYLVGVPCVTLRSTTEWTETVDAGWNTLTGLDPGRVVTALEQNPPVERPALYGDAHAAQRVVDCLMLPAL